MLNKYRKIVNHADYGPNRLVPSSIAPIQIISIVDHMSQCGNTSVAFPYHVNVPCLHPVVGFIIITRIN